MTEIRLKRITLFLLETLILQNTNKITDFFVYLFNEFIYKCYRENKELLSIMYDTEILGKAIEGNYEILSLDQMFQLMRRYREFDGYVDLVESVGPKIDAQINELALLFIEFQKELFNLYKADSNMYYPKGYPKILQ